MNKKTSILSFCLATVLLISCKKSTTTPATTVKTAPGTVLNSEANVVLIPTYETLANDAALLSNGAALLQTTATQQNLVACRQLWLTADADYEQSAASLFGAGGALGADPASIINTYPIDTGGINQLINSAVVFNETYIDSLPPYLTGFHGLEFELYGINGNKLATQLSPQQLAYIAAVAQSIATQTADVAADWSTSFVSDFVNAGNGSTVYPTQRAAFNDLTMAIANITETDAIYKLEGILFNKSVILQESPFANNSVAEIQNNLIGVSNIYNGQYGGVTGTGLTVFVHEYAVNLDYKIKNDIIAAQSAVGKITLPLSQAIYSQTTQINNAIIACDSVDDDLKVDLLTYINTYTN